MGRTRSSVAAPVADIAFPTKFSELFWECFDHVGAIFEIFADLLGQCCNLALFKSSDVVEALPKAEEDIREPND